MNFCSYRKKQYLAKRSVIGVDLASIPKEQFNGECLPPIEVSDFLGYLVLEASRAIIREKNSRPTKV